MVAMPHKDRAAYNAYMQTYLNNRYAKFVAIGRQRLGGQCVGCGTSSDLHFHHIDPSTKTLDVTELTHVSMARFMAEVEKCELRCRGCHVEVHRPSHACGTVGRYRSGCRCGDCRAASTAYHRRYAKARQGHRTTRAQRINARRVALGLLLPSAGAGVSSLATTSHR